MARLFEVVYEGGVLRPLEPLPFAENQRLTVAVDEGDKEIKSQVKWDVFFTKEMEWLRLHRKEHQGEYVALDGDRLVAHGKDGREVFRRAREQGVEVPFVSYTPPADEPPFGGW
jgi:predicted DNA-binding antitoxin AbrB/MazE fold protein